MTLREITVYMAGPYKKKQAVDARGRQLHDEFGMHVISRWHKNGFEPDGASVETLTEAQRMFYALANVVDLKAAHWLVLHSDLGGSTRGGMHWEHGYALARNLYCIVIGSALNASLFAHLPQNNVYQDWQSFVQFLKGGKE